MTTKENYTPQVYDVLYYLSDDDGNEMLDENGNVKLFTNPSGHIGGDCDLAEGIEAEDLNEINNKIITTEDSGYSAPGSKSSSLAFTSSSLP